MVNAESDFIYDVEESQKPLFALLGTPPDRKRHVVFPGSHAIVSDKRSQVIREILDWFDRYLRTALGRHGRAIHGVISIDSSSARWPRNKSHEEGPAIRTTLNTFQYQRRACSVARSRTARRGS